MSIEHVYPSQTSKLQLTKNIHLIYENEICSSSTLEHATNPGKKNVDNPFAQLCPHILQHLKSQTVTLWRLNPAIPGMKHKQLDMSDTQNP